MHKIWQILLRSFGCLVTGVWPNADWTGRLFTEDYLPEAAKNVGLPLCGGYRFAVWQLSADLYLPLQLPGASPLQFFDTLLLLWV